MVEEYCIDQNCKPTWNLQEALSHEVVHVIVGNTPGHPYRASAFVFEEGLAYHNSMRLFSFLNYEGHANILNAVACIDEALRAVPDLLTKWRNQNDEARAVQTLTDDDLRCWRLGDDLRRRLLSDFE